jgi:hypothetical protein
MGTFEYKTPGDRTDLIEMLRGGDRRRSVSGFDEYVRTAGNRLIRACKSALLVPTAPGAA